MPRGGRTRAGRARGVRTQGRARGGRGRGVRGRGKHAAIGGQFVDVTSSEFIAKNNGRKWTTVQPNPNVRKAARNIMRITRCGPKGPANDVKEIIEAWSLYIDDEMIQTMIQHSTAEANRVYEVWNTVNPEKQQKHFVEPDVVEMKAFFGLMYIRGANKRHHTYLQELWSDRRGLPEFRATMSRDRYKELLRFLRFDDKSTREERRRSDKFAPIRELFEIFNEKCKSYWRLSEQVTIDETLRAFRGRCPFKIYNPMKPAKYGILFRVVTDALYRYVHFMKVYAGMPDDAEAAQIAKNGNKVANLVKELTQEIWGSSRNVTMDRYYGDIDLMIEMADELKLTVVATIKSNRMGVPVEMTKPFGRPVLSTLFAWSKNVMMLSYVKKKNVTVLLVSTEHTLPEIDKGPKQKPNVMLDYNACKGGVDTVDQMMDAYPAKSAVRRWPMIVFSTMLDAAALNAFAIWNSLFPFWKSSIHGRKRRQFLLELGDSLIKPHIERRNLGSLSNTIVRDMQLLVPEIERPRGAYFAKKLENKTKCRTCLLTDGTGKTKTDLHKSANKVKQQCDGCGDPTCNKHGEKVVSLMCRKCLEVSQQDRSQQQHSDGDEELMDT